MFFIKIVIFLTPILINLTFGWDVLSCDQNNINIAQNAIKDVILTHESELDCLHLQGNTTGQTALQTKVFIPELYTQPMSLYIHWEHADIEIKNAGGFYLELSSRDGSGIKTCNVFRIRKPSNAHVSYQREHPGFMLSLNESFVEEDKEYLIQVYSIAARHDLSDSKVSNIVNTHIPKFKQYEVSPAEWATRIYTNNHQGRVDVCFTLGLPKWNFTFYEVALVKVADRFKEIKTVKIEDLKKTFYRAKFEVNDTDIYKIQVEVNRNLHTNRCVCWLKREFRRPMCHHRCKAVGSYSFILQAKPVGLPIKQKLNINSSLADENVGLPIKQKLNINSSLTDENENKVQVPSIWMYALALVGAITVVSGLVIVWCRCKRKTNKNEMESVPLKHQIDTSSNQTDEIAEREESPKYFDYKHPSKKKSVYILCAEESEVYLQVVDAFAKYLQNNCFCQIIYANWHYAHEVGGFAWVAANISQADIVIFIQSHQAVCLLKAFLSNETYSDARFGPEGDLFTLGLKHIYSQNNNNRVVLVTLDKSFNCKQLLLVPQEFRIPEHMPQFIERLHEIKPSERKNYEAFLPLKHNVLEVLPDGINLMQASKELRKYNLENDNEKRVGCQDLSLTKKSFSTVHSNSDQFLKEKLMSISTQNVNILNSQNSEHEKIQGKSFGDEKSIWLSFFSEKKTSEKLQKYKSESDLCSEINLDSPKDDLSLKSKGIQNIISNIIPPDSHSDVKSDISSLALREFYHKNEQRFLHSDQHKIDSLVLDTNNVSIVPPEELFDVTSDSISLALRTMRDTNELQYFY